MADTELNDAHLRVLCAMGTFTNRLGGNVWASVETMATACGLSPRTVQRAIPQLVAKGYLRQTVRPGRTTLYDILLDQGVTGVSGGDDAPVTPPPTPVSPKREKKNDELTILAQQLTKMIWSVYPDRDTPHLFPPALRAIHQALKEGADPSRMVRAAEEYSKECFRKQTEPRFVRSIPRFYADGAWEHYGTEIRVHGRTREEWARSGQDVAEFDTLAQEQVA